MVFRFSRFTASCVFTCATLLNPLAASSAAADDAPCCVRGAYLSLPVINFASDSAELGNREITKLDRLVELLEDYPNVSLLVFGHTDSQGSVAYNQALSVRRSRAVVGFLVAKGVAESRLQRRGMSEGRPMATNADEAGRADNRRVVFAER